MWAFTVCAYNILGLHATLQLATYPSPQGRKGRPLVIFFPSWE